MPILSHQNIGASQWQLNNEKECCIDCSRISFYEPIGLTFLAGYITNQFATSDSINIRFHRETLNYLERIGLLPFLETEFADKITITPNRPNIRSQDLQGRLVEFQKVEFSYRFDLEGNIQNLVELCSMRSVNKIPIVFIDDVFGELLDNILRHSGVSNYFVVAQSYSNTIKISISDLGIGIPGKIRPAFQKNKQTQKQ